MRGFTPNTVCQYGLFTYLVLFSFLSFTAAVSFDLTELRNKVAKIKVNPRGNLWATGHFMGKRAWWTPLCCPQPRLPMRRKSPPRRARPGSFFQEFLRVALRAQLDTRDSRSKTQEADLLMKILESYFQSRK